MHSSKFIKILKVIVLVAIGIVVFGGGVMLLWNWLIPSIFDGPRISFWQAIGLLVLARILTGGFRKPWNGSAKQHWRKKWKKKWQKMTPEERERLKEKYGHRCGGRKEPKDVHGDD